MTGLLFTAFYLFFLCVFGGGRGGFCRRRSFYSRMQIGPKHSRHSTLFIFVAIGILQERSIWWPCVALFDAMTVFSRDLNGIFILPTPQIVFSTLAWLCVWVFFLGECVRPHFEDSRRLCMKLANQGRLLLGKAHVGVSVHRHASKAAKKERFRAAPVCRSIKLVNQCL